MGRTLGCKKNLGNAANRKEQGRGKLKIKTLKNPGKLSCSEKKRVIVKGDITETNEDKEIGGKDV